MVFSKTKEWLEKEKELGSPDPYNIVLATATKEGVPHSRIVAIREITTESILFFTQRHTKKVQELTENPRASMTLWLPLQQREVVIDGNIKSLSEEESVPYWQTLSRERQLRFSVYAATSGQPIDSLSELMQRQEMLDEKFKGSSIPLSENAYCGFRLFPQTFYFYTLGKDTFSEVIKYTLVEENWKQQSLSP